MKSLMTWMIAGAFAFLAVGCVAQKEADDLRTLYRKSQEQVIELQAQLEEANARIAALMDASNKSPDALMAARLEKLMAERDQLQAALDKALAELRAAATNQPMALPEDLSSALEELAALNPDLMTYDEARGMVRLRSDLTFGSGSDAVKAGAKASLGKLATVLKSEAALPYEVRIVGHTDNVRISRAATKAKHPTNWHLSVHRAISVKDVLGAAGVPSTRMSIAGYGEFQPIVPNTKKGAEGNRRVEIFLVAMAVQAEPDDMDHEPGDAAAAALQSQPAADDTELYK